MPAVAGYVATSLFSGHLPDALVAPGPRALLKSYVHAYLPEKVEREGFARSVGASSRFLVAASYSQTSLLSPKSHENARQSGGQQTDTSGFSMTCLSPQRSPSYAAGPDVVWTPASRKSREYARGRSSNRGCEHSTTTPDSDTSSPSGEPPPAQRSISSRMASARSSLSK